MKRFVCLFLCLGFLVGCSDSHRAIEPLTRGIEFSAEIKYYNELYECDCQVNNSGEMNVEFRYPVELEGLKFTISDKGVSSEYRQLEYINQNSIFENTAAHLIWDVLVNSSDEVKSENDVFFLEGDSENFKYRLELGSSGLPIKLVTTPDIIEVVFKNVRIK